jgi:S1-C subfamily serine protease
VGFAVPVDTINRVVPQIIQTGHYSPPGLGIETDELLSRAIARQLGVSGAAIARVFPNGPAARAGLRAARLGSRRSIIPGDVIIGVNGQEVDSVGRLLARLDDHKPGDTVRLKIWRDGKELQVTATLQAGE